MTGVEYDLSQPGVRAMLRDLERQGLVKIGHPVKPPGAGQFCVYVFATQPTGPVKVGITENATKRIQSLTTASGRRLRCYAATVVESREIARQIERDAHRELADARLPGEWFRVAVSRAVWAVAEAHARVSPLPLP